MRKTVDEKLHDTLEKRLGESFKLVSERLEAVQRGLGEMQSLATGVGDLKRVLTNVKARGTWAEVQLGALLEQILTPAQFGRNVQTKEDSRELVEYAVGCPGPRTTRTRASGCLSTRSSRRRTTSGCRTPRSAGDADAVQKASDALARVDQASRPSSSARSTSARRTRPTSRSCSCRPRGSTPKCSRHPTLLRRAPAQEPRHGRRTDDARPHFSAPAAWASRRLPSSSGPPRSGRSSPR